MVPQSVMLAPFGGLLNAWTHIDFLTVVSATYVQLETLTQIAQNSSQISQPLSKLWVWSLQLPQQLQCRRRPRELQRTQLHARQR